MRSRSLLPPRKRDWTPGTYQIGAFVRTPEGTVFEMVSTKPVSKARAELVLDVMRGRGKGRRR